MSIRRVGATGRAEKVLKSRRKFENERLNTEDVEMEDLNFYYADYSRYVCCSFPLVRMPDIHGEGSFKLTL